MGSDQRRLYNPVGLQLAIRLEHQLHFSAGDGAVLNAPSAFNVTFWGIVLDDFEEFVYNEGNPASDWLPPAINTPGTFLLSCEVPIDQAPFQQVVGRDPLDGESVEQWNAASQTDSTTTYEGGTWSNGAPALAVGEAALFTLVPEPGTITLFGRRSRRRAGLCLASPGSQPGAHGA